MSELNKKIQKYINRSQVTVYQLAKNTNLDRTMIQKMIKGTKYPGAKFFYKFCDSLMLNKDERDELIRLFRIEKIGSSKYQARIAIRELLTRFQNLRANYFANGIKPMQAAIDVSLITEPARELEGSTALMLYAYSLLHEKISSREHTEVWLDMFGQTEALLRNIHSLQDDYGTQVEIHHSILLSYQSNSEESNAENIEILQSVFPPLFVMGENYHAYYAYVNNISEDRRFTPFRHYLLVDDRLLLFNDRANRGLFVTDPAIVSAWQHELRQMEEESRPIFRYWNDVGEALSYYREHISSVNRLVASYETTPCMNVLISGALGEVPTDHPVIRLYQSSFDNIAQDVSSSEYIQIYGLGGMKEFAKTGVLPEIYGKYLPAFSEKSRHEMVDTYTRWLCLTGNSWLLKDVDMQIAAGLNIELYAPNKVVLCSIQKDMPFGFVLIEENSTYDNFLDYFQSLIEYEEVYEPEAGTEVFRHTMEAYFQEGEN